MTQLSNIRQKQVTWLVKWFLPFCLFTFMPLSLNAQVVIDEDEIDIESEEEEVDEEDEEIAESVVFAKKGYYDEFLSD